MSRSPRFIAALTTSPAWLALAPQPAWACATCFGAPDSSLTQGLNMGILSLLVVVLVVLGGAVTFFVHLARRTGGAEPGEAREKALPVTDGRTR